MRRAGSNQKNNTHNVARLAVRFLLHGKEGLATQLGAAGHADEAVHVEDLVHGGAAGALADHVLPAAGAAACGDTEDTRWTRSKGQVSYGGARSHPGGQTPVPRAVHGSCRVRVAVMVFSDTPGSKQKGSVERHLQLQ